MSEKSQDLTEQCKKGELEKGYYYMQTPNGDIRIITECLKVDCDGFSILAPVPSYEEWQNINEFADYSIHNRNELTKQINYLFDENEKLSQWNIKAQELLKKCKPYITQAVSRNFYEDDVSLRDRYLNKDSLLTKIDEVLK